MSGRSGDVTGVDAGGGPLAVVALGGNALLRRGEPLEAANQVHAADQAARLLAAAAITHGNGPQVGLLALMGDAYPATKPYPLDVLDAETEGQIGYVLELALDNHLTGQHAVTLITRVVVDPHDPGLVSPSKFIGPIYDERRARELSAEHGWTIKRDGERWRRVVASPQPKRIVQLDAIERLVEAGFVVVCAGGGGVPVVEEPAGRYRGVEGVIDKDRASALLAIDLGAERLVLATDVDAVYRDYGSAGQRRLGATAPAELRKLSFPAGSMGPKVEAACSFVEATGGRAAIGSLDELPQLLEGRAGTQVLGNGPVAEQANQEKRHAVA